MTGPNLTLRLQILGFALLLLLAVLAGCGFSDNHSNNSNNGGTGPSDGSGNISGRYVYVADAADAGGAFAWKLDSAGNLSEVPGSPFTLPAGGNLQGALAASGGFVYVVNRPVETGGAAIHSFKADASTGALTQKGKPVTITTPSDSDIRQMRLSPSESTAYAVTQFNLISISLNNGSPALLNTQAAANGEVFGVAVGSQFVFAGTQDGNPKQGFAQPVIKRFVVNSDSSLGAGQVVTTLTDANIPRGIAMDPAGKFLAVTTGTNNDSVTIFSVGSDGSLTKAGTGPTNGRNGHALEFDPSGKFLYALTSEDPVPNQESVVVFSVGADGSLTSVQTLDLPSGVRNGGFKVTTDFVIVVNNSVGGIDSSIVVLRRDSSSGQLSSGSSINGVKPLGEIDTLVF